MEEKNALETELENAVKKRFRECYYFALGYDHALCAADLVKAAIMPVLQNMALPPAENQPKAPEEQTGPSAEMATPVILPQVPPKGKKF